MGDWQPIATAPKDGSHILACRIPLGIRVTVNTHPPTVVHWFDDGFYTSVNEIAPERPYNPTHWQPLGALSDANDLDEVVHALGIEDSHITPAEAVQMLQDKIAILQTALSDLLKTTPEERQDPAIWLARVDAARSALGNW